ncbi:restriction endonuclease subunit S [Catenibacterium mitsuokai]|uniref:restriction endonuclease subunit S n=1 Tax=Catenibacterium mitsuokai TaxID=100886 RepID=UPI003F90AFC3
MDNRMTAQKLRNSILQMAVQGKLVPQDPNDEPASVLLERIRKEKEQLIKEGKIKKNKKESCIFRGADNLHYEQIGKKVRCIEDEVPFEIPESWEWVRLSSVVYNHGQTKPEEDFCYIDIGSVDNQHQKLSAVETIIPPEKAPSRARKIICKDDIIYSTVRPYLHNMCIIDRNFSKMPIASTGFAVFTCHADFYNEFLFYYLMSPDFDSYANNVENSKGVAYPAINDTRLYKALIPLPPVDEQHRIVDKIKSVLPEIEKYDLVETELSNMNRDFPENLKRSILQWAVQGRLVPQDPSDEPAEVLLERIRTEKQRLVKEGKIKKDKHESIIFRRDNSHYEKLNGIERCIDDEIPFDIPKNWCWCRLGSVVEKLTDGTHKTPKYQPSGIPFLSVKDISSGKISFDDCKYVSQAEHNELYNRCDPKFGDMLLTKVGTTGIPVLINTKIEFSLFVSVALVKFNHQYLYDKYFLYMLQSPLVQKQCAKNTKGVGNKNWVMRDIANTLLAIPPITEQHHIVEKIEQLLNVTNRL